ncbi:hypothetical protein R1flu_010970 [Riccia fluitans]|uniref:Uncharacterized protein n=1 Tax=Riccia fluitans TaxID=41844 RepID=A0ABD1Z7F4_9MARC
MEEEKAAAYYDELVRKGGNAAKYKQGLGFEDSQAPPLPKSERYGSLSNFVKSSPGRTAAVERECRLDSIRDKLRRKEDDNSLRKASPDRNRKRDREDYRDQRRRRSSRTPESPRRDRKREKSSRHKSSSLRDSDPEIVKKVYSERQKRSRSRSRSRRSDSPKSRARAETPEKNSTVKARECPQSRSPSPSRSSSGASHERWRRHSRQTRKDRSTSPEDYGRHSRSTSKRRSRRSRSRSVERRRRRSRSRSHSYDKGTNGRKPQRRSSSFSPRRAFRRERSRSPPCYTSSYRRREDSYGERVSERSSRYRTDIKRRRYEDERKADGSYRDRNHRSGERSRSGQEKTQERNYSKLIPNFDSMTPAEKVKAKMKLQLSETVVKDKSKGMSDEWERFDFDKNAPLDDDAKQDYFGDGTGAGDDTTFLKNTGSTFVSWTNQVTREAERQSIHDNAIFGPPQGLRIRVSKPEAHPEVEKNDHSQDSEDQPVIVEEAAVCHKDETPDESLMAKPGATMVVSEQVIAMQQAGSWQERARHQFLLRHLCKGRLSLSSQTEFGIRGFSWSYCSKGSVFFL